MPTTHALSRIWKTIKTKQQVLGSKSIVQMEMDVLYSKVLTHVVMCFADSNFSCETNIYNQTTSQIALES